MEEPGDGASVSEEETQEFPIFVRRRANEAYSVMNFRCTEDVVFAEWREARMRREDNSHSQERGPPRATTGAGTEGGRRPPPTTTDQVSYRPEDQPWLLRVDGRRRRTFRGRREGGIADHSAYYIFAMQADGTIEATPVSQWHTFEPLHTYKTLSIEEAEQLYKNRDKKLDYFAVMIQKRLNDAKLEAEEENDGSCEGAGAGTSESGEANDRDGRSGESSADEDDGARKKCQREQSRAKMNRLYSGESDDEQIAEMDDDDDSSDSLEADEDEADAQDQKDGEGNVEEGKEEEKNETEAASGEDKEPEEGEITENKRTDEASGEETAAASASELPVVGDRVDRSDGGGGEGGRGGDKDGGGGGGGRHRRRPGGGGSGDWRAPRAALPPELAALEEAARRHLRRRPLTVQQLLRRLKPHRRDLPADRVVDAMGRVLRAINPRRRLVHGKMYLFVD